MKEEWSTLVRRSLANVYGCFCRLISKKPASEPFYANGTERFMGEDMGVFKRFLGLRGYLGGLFSSFGSRLVRKQKLNRKMETGLPKLRFYIYAELGEI